MPAIKICIERNEQGQFTVGIDPAAQSDQSVEGLMQPEGMPAGQHTMPDGQQMGGDAGGMNPAADLEDALNQARSLLAEPQTEQQAFASA